MARNPACTIYVGNLDERVSERVLYEILIQVGRVVDLHIPRDKESNRQKGFAFAEYETEEIANYAIKLFSGLVRLHNKTLKFAKSGQDKNPQNNATPATPKMNSPPKTRLEDNTQTVNIRGNEPYQGSALSGVNSRFSVGAPSGSPQGPASGAYGNYEYSRRVLGSMLNSVSCPGANHPIAYPSY